MNQNFIHEEIMGRLKSGNACCLSVQNVLSSSLLYNYVKTKIDRTIISSLLYVCETWSLTFRRNTGQE